MYGDTGDGGDDESMDVEQISRQLASIRDNPDDDTFEEDNGDSDETGETCTDDDGDDNAVSYPVRSIPASDNVSNGLRMLPQFCLHSRPKVCCEDARIW